jgi:ABC-type multidrug transport system permease subunit
MKNWLILLWGELMRLWKYKILLFGFLVSLIWVLIVSLVNRTEALSLMPMLLVLDTGMMVILLLASSYYFEKQEGTIKTLFVTPIHAMQLLSAKIASTFVSGLISMTLIGLAVWLIHGIDTINYPLAFLYVVLSTLAHVAIGFLLIFSSIDFMSLLMKHSMLMLVLLLPSVLEPLALIPENLRYFNFLSPSYASQILMHSLITPMTLPLQQDVGFALTSLVILSLLMYPLFIYPAFKQEATKS